MDKVDRLNNLVGSSHHHLDLVSETVLDWAHNVNVQTATDRTMRQWARSLSQVFDGRSNESDALSASGTDVT